MNKHNISRCYSQHITKSDEERRSYFPGWKLAPNQSNFPKSSPPSAWHYQTGSESDTDYDIWGRTAIHKGGGYIVSLGLTRKTADTVINKLRAHRWIDQQTRVIIVEFSLYNINKNLLSAIVLTIDFPGTGGGFSRLGVFPFRLYRYLTKFQVMYLVCEIIFIVFIIHLSYKVFYQIYEEKWKYFLSFWNITDFALIVASFVGICYYVLRTVELRKGIYSIQKNSRLFYDFYHITRLDECLAYTLCFIFIIPTIQFLRFMKFNKNFMIFYLTLQRTSGEIGGFGVILLLSLLCFSLWSFVMLNTEEESYSTFSNALGNTVAVLLGTFNFHVFQVKAKDLGLFFTYAFATVNSFIVLNIILAVIAMGFKEAQKDERFQTSEYEIMKFVIQNVQGALGLLQPWKPPPAPVIREKITTVNYVELQWKLHTKYVQVN